MNSDSTPAANDETQIVDSIPEGAVSVAPEIEAALADVPAAPTPRDVDLPAKTIGAGRTSQAFHTFSSRGRVVGVTLTEGAELVRIMGGDADLTELPGGGLEVSAGSFLTCILRNTTAEPLEVKTSIRVIDLGGRVAGETDPQVLGRVGKTRVAAGSLEVAQKRRRSRTVHGEEVVKRRVSSVSRESAPSRSALLLARQRKQSADRAPAAPISGTDVKAGRGEVVASFGRAILPSLLAYAARGVPVPIARVPAALAGLKGRGGTNATSVTLPEEIAGRLARMFQRGERLSPEDRSVLEIRIRRAMTGAAEVAAAVETSSSEVSATGSEGRTS